jgi:hypothetical protein
LKARTPFVVEEAGQAPEGDWTLTASTAKLAHTPKPSLPLLPSLNSPFFRINEREEGEGCEPRSI